MNTKNLYVVLLTAFLIVASMTIASALSYTVSTPATLTKTTSSANFTITNSETFAINTTLTIPATFSDGTDTVALTATGVPTTIAAGSSAVITLTRGEILEAFDIGVFSNTISVAAVQSTNSSNAQTKTTTVELINSLCSLGSLNSTNLKLDVEINNDANGDGDESEWYPRDVITVEVDFDNDADFDLDDVIIELGLIDKETGANIAADEDLILWASSDEEQAEVGDVDEDESAKATFEFTLSNEIEAGDYLLMVKAYPEDEEDITCLDSADGLSKTYYEPIIVKRESEDSRLVILEDAIIEPTETACGNEVIFTAKAYNIGSDDQTAVKVSIYNKDLGVDASQIITNLDWDESENVEISFTLPTTASEGSYTLNFYTRYDYDEDEDDNDDATYDNEYFGETGDLVKVYVRAKGNCVGSIVESAEIDAALSEGDSITAGKEAIIIATIKNTGNTATKYTISTSGLSSWAELASITPESITIAAGESKDVEIAFTADSDAEGDKEFTVRAEYGASKSTEATIIVSVEKGGFFSSITGSTIGSHLKSNWFIYTIVIVDVILIVAIILAVRSMLAKK